MKVETVRKRMVAITRRLDRELALLDRMFPRVDLANNFDETSEAIRNLATAARHMASFAAMSNEGIQRELDAYGPSRRHSVAMETPHEHRSRRETSP